MDKIPAVVIGAGVVGCAVAQALTRKSISPLILESGPRIAEGVTSRNSGIVHAGIYYPPGSLKARSCIHGKILLKQWCNDHRVPWLETGKWIVGQAIDEKDLHATLKNAKDSGATGLSWKNKKEIEMELPQVNAELAIYSQETGIVDPYLFSKSLLEDAQLNGAELITDTKVTGIDIVNDGYILHTTRGDIETELVVNCAGLYADEVARLVGIEKYKIYPWRGDYFKSRKNLGLKTLVYPAKKKNSPGLGIHVTLDMAGAMKLGPDVELASSKSDFASREDKLNKFFEAASTYLVGLEKDDLVYDTVGIRPKLRSPIDTSEHDFIISQDLPGFINLMGIESPGLTSSMALANDVLALL